MSTLAHSEYEIKSDKTGTVIIEHNLGFTPAQVIARNLADDDTHLDSVALEVVSYNERFIAGRIFDRTTGKVAPFAEMDVELTFVKELS